MNSINFKRLIEKIEEDLGKSLYLNGTEWYGFKDHFNGPEVVKFIKEKGYEVTVEFNLFNNQTIQLRDGEIVVYTTNKELIKY